MDSKDDNYKRVVHFHIGKKQHISNIFKQSIIRIMYRTMNSVVQNLRTKNPQECFDVSRE